MDRKMILYRGSLKSCNYACSYCPFSKHPSSGRERDKDEKEWLRFCESVKERAGGLGPFALMVVPYGEALLHSWYWKGLGELSALKQAEAVGAQTNLSFGLEDALNRFEAAGGRREKLRLWATFHPEMISAEEFAAKCRAVQEAGIILCVGAVGVPENLSLLTKLRTLLPESVYLWINRMDGLGRPYTQDEEQGFAAVDPFFIRELAVIYAQKEYCRNRLFIEAGGRMRTCNISAFLPGNWYQEKSPFSAFSFSDTGCGRKVCSCYLAYGGRKDMVNSLLFGKYPLFRVPRRFAAAFLDIDGTLLRDGEKTISPLTAVSLKALAANGTKLFFATSLPMPEARRKCREVWPLFTGGVFAGGAHIVYGKIIYGESADEESACRKARGKEKVYPLDEAVLAAAKEQKSRFSFRLSVYRRQGVLYKITLTFPGCMMGKEDEVKAVYHSLPETLRLSVRVIWEGTRLQFISAGTGKDKGVEEICREWKIPLKNVIAAGDSQEDEAMTALCGEGLNVSQRK